MELIQYIQLFRRWFWLIALGAILAGGASYISNIGKPTLYQARATLLIGSYFGDPNPQSGELYVSMGLAQTYAAMATNYGVLQEAVERNNLPLSPGGLAGMVSTNIVPETSLLEITLTHTDPDLVVIAADAVAEQLVLNSPTNLTPAQQAQIDLANAEIVRLQEQLNQARLRLTDVQTQINNSQDEAEIESLTVQYNTLIQQINQTSANIANFTNTIASLQQRINSIEIIEPARLRGMIRNSVFSTVVLAAMVGAALAIGTALVIEYLNDSLRTPEQIREMLGLPTLALIPQFGKKKDGYPDRLITYLDPDSPVSEEYRTLRTNLMHASNGNRIVYVVTSPGPSEGKTVTVSNLAVAMASAGWRVLLIDADLRRPKLHQVFNLPNDVGLSTLLGTIIEPNSREDNPTTLHALFEGYTHETHIAGLQIMTSGPLPLNPTEVLGSFPMGYWIERFQTLANIDIVLIDTPPTLVAADGAVLASTFHFPVILVVESGSTRAGVARRALDRLAALDIDIKGAVLNAVSRRDQGYSYGYSYYYYYYYQQEKGEKPGANANRPEEVVQKPR